MFFLYLILIIFLALVLLLFYFLFKKARDSHESWKDKARKEELELRQSMKIVQSIDQFNHWIFKYSDEEFVKHYKNTETGSVSQDRLASLKLYDKFIDLGESFFLIKKGIYNLPPSFFSPVSIEAYKELSKIEKKKRLLLEALNRKHITSTEAILTVRTSMKLYYNLICVPLSDIANLDIENIQDGDIKSKDRIDIAKRNIDKVNSSKTPTDKKLKIAYKRTVRDSNKLISHEKKEIKKRKDDFKLRSYLINHGDIQSTARRYLKYISDLKTPYTTEELSLLD